MPRLTVPETIEIGDISTYLSANYIETGRIYGDRLSQDMDTTIAMITDALRWQWLAFPDVAEIRATGKITIDSLGDEGDIMMVYVNDPQLGTIVLGQHIQTVADTTTIDFATALAAACTLNPYGYEIQQPLGANYFTVTAREGLGATINGNNNLYVVIVPTPVEFISAENDFRIITQTNTPITYITTETY